MVVTPLPTQMMPQLQQLLERMNICAQELESIMQTENNAIRALDADLILQVSDQRILAHQCLAQLEQQCHQLLQHHQISEELTLSIIIDMYAGAQTSNLQALRRNLYEQMLKVDQQSQENRMRLSAAYNVSTTILQGLGLSQQEQTYHRGTNG